MEFKSQEPQNVPQPAKPAVASPAPNANTGLSPLEKINLVRQRDGLEPLKELPGSHKTEQEIKDEQEALRAAQEAAKKAESEQAQIQARLDEEERQRQALAEKEKEDRIREEEARKAELDDAKVLAYLQSKDPSIKSLDDVARRQKTAEEIQKEKDDREADMLAFGLKNGKFTKAKFEKYAQDSKNPVDLVFSRQFEEAKADDPTLREEDFRSEFNEKYGIGYAEDSRRFKQGQKDISMLAQTIIRSEYGEIISLNQEYSSYEEQQNRERSSQMKIMANRPAFEKDVREVVSGFTKYTVGAGDNAIAVEVTPAIIEEVRSSLLSDDYSQNAILAGWSQEKLKQVVDQYIISRDRENIMQKYAEAYSLEKQKGSRGIPPLRTGNEKPETVTVTDKQKLAAERHGAIVPAPGQA